MSVFILQNLISLVASHYIYDRSDLYKMEWLEKLRPQKILLVTAGFDETSDWLTQRFPAAEVVVCDFYNPQKHTEISIERARKKYPSKPGTVSVKTSEIPFANETFDLVIAFLSAHEIREDKERITFFRELNRVLKPECFSFVTEHIRDGSNFLVYNIGAFHFHSRQTWFRTFVESGFQMYREYKITPFVSTFMINKNDNTA
ncbi:class I SAM-dependent methyltransferase [Flavobacterium silvaticum]|uniref:Class I SAM-dependent methyltransferase n=1 Tax=Flavobacterium silvaticum TaxID=1852020 RepID=A0A972FUK5_9FLAO|nr:class I SAM-dependent methyltransferase [Flavobacterium silvaticum]NMH28312.1 class I SAM-dependent methyltransferase [Flavobacterium silvaticum]